MAINNYIKKEENYEINNLNFYHKTLEKAEKDKYYISFICGIS